ncbi:protease inhibitor I42 family protein [Brevibacillus brevis]|uniref:Protease inhibitor I42 family protein n=1 Tax=Brevibacillus brevis TaxID=1393 RepID=A0ABY9T0S7_BREBE|nr:protease inhibitor I42 family protein [Brevibacillus brevis]WNC12567.1 protease inhibitor I42 family protein [Brevibacillus brevis]
MAQSKTHSIRVSEGHSFVLTFASNPSTGYQWFLSNPLDNQYLSLAANEYVPPTSPSRIGQSGHQLFTFHALQKGMTSIAMKYCRPWDAGDCGSFDFTIVTIT